MVGGGTLKLDYFSSSREQTLNFCYQWIAIKLALKQELWPMDDGYICNMFWAEDYYTFTANLNCLGFMCFYQGTTHFFGYFFNIFYLYTLCTFYYLCKLCLYDLFIVLLFKFFLGVNELAFMLYLLFFGMLLIFGSEANLQYEYSPPLKFTLAL